MRKGFTLLEVLVVVIIVTILAGIALPNYTRSVEKARMRDAEAKLNLIFQAERMYALDNSGFANRGSLIPSYCLEPNSTDFSFTIGGSPFPVSYTATATRQGGGKYAGSTISLTNNFTGSYTYTGQYNSNGNPN